jgi:hypothetical protein
MLRRVDLVRTEVSEERVASIIRVIRIGQLGTLAVTSNCVFILSMFRFLVTIQVSSSPIFVTLMMETIPSFETSDLTRTTQRNTPEDAILHSHRPENLKLVMKRFKVEYGHS